MGKNTSVILTEYYENIVNREVKSGRYTSASEVVREGLRLLNERAEKIEAINKELIKGEKSGKPIKYNFNNFLKSMKIKHKKNA